MFLFITSSNLTCNFVSITFYVLLLYLYSFHYIDVPKCYFVNYEIFFTHWNAACSVNEPKSQVSIWNQSDFPFLHCFGHIFFGVLLFHDQKNKWQERSHKKIYPSLCRRNMFFVLFLSHRDPSVTPLTTDLHDDGVCVCVCVCARARVCVCVHTYTPTCIHAHKYRSVLWWLGHVFSRSITSHCWFNLLHSLHHMHWSSTILHLSFHKWNTLFHQITIHLFHSPASPQTNKMHFRFLIPALKEIPATLHQTCIN